jgi:ABC-type Fe3+/spermidine/putrescine transport system ATPase subunit
LAGIASSSSVDLFVRPEQIELVDASRASAASGRVVAQVYQGGHVDVVVACTEAVGGRLLVRLRGHDAMQRWPIGIEVGISIRTDESVAFAVEQNA